LSPRRIWRAAGLAALVAAVGVGLFFLLRPAVLAEQRWQAIRARGVLRIGIDPGVQPFSFFGPQGWEGFDADVARAVASRLGLSVEARPVGYDGFYDALIAGHADVAMSALVADQARMADFRYSRPYVDVGLRIIGAAESWPVRPDDLRGRCVAVALGGEGDRVARWLERRTPGLVRRVVVGEDDALAEVRAGACELAIVGGRRAMHEGCPLLDGPNQPPGVRCLRLRPVEYVAAFLRSDARLAEEFDRVLAELAADGTLERIARRWFGPPGQSPARCALNSGCASWVGGLTRWNTDPLDEPA